MINANMLCIHHPEGMIKIEETSSGKRMVSVAPANQHVFIRTDQCLTDYPVKLITQIIEAKGASYVCDEIHREQDPYYIEHHLKTTLFAYVKPEAFVGKRFLDFGCGAGASTMAFARNLPHTSIVGIELEPANLAIAKARAAFYHYSNIELHQSPSPEHLPDGIGTFDYIFLPAVYEHLLPHERIALLKQLWSILKPEGVLFIDETPHRWFPVETHTTGLPLINYFPSVIAHWYATAFSHRHLSGDSWNTLLRKGIRGSTPSAILQTLKKFDKKNPLLLPSQDPVLRSPVDIWYEGYAKHEKGKKVHAKRALKTFLSALYSLTGIALVPYLSIAIKKQVNRTRS